MTVLLSQLIVDNRNDSIETTSPEFSSLELFCYIAIRKSWSIMGFQSYHYWFDDSGIAGLYRHEPPQQEGCETKVQPVPSQVLRNLQSRLHSPESS